MDTAVALVQTYLNINGYFTVVEYPVLEAYRGAPARSVTDLDVVALRFAHAGHELVHKSHSGAATGRVFDLDAALGCPADRPDMIVGEVKEGPARFNVATRDPAVLAVALARFGCCLPEHASDLARRLLSRGHADSPAGHRVRMVAFGSAPEPGHGGNWTTVPMSHVVHFLRTYLREDWAVLRHTQIKDPTLGILALMEKWREDANGARVATRI